jgi:type III secretion protein O
VRHFREEAAQQLVRKAELDLRDAQNAVEQKKQELDNFHSWRIAEENRRYESIMNMIMSIPQLDSFKADLAILADKEVQKNDDVITAQKVVTQCEEALNKSREEAKLAQKNTAKIQAHKELWAVDAKKEAERMEDLELEEFRPIARKGAEAEGEDA